VFKASCIYTSLLLDVLPCSTLSPGLAFNFSNTLFTMSSTLRDGLGVSVIGEAGGGGYVASYGRSVVVGGVVPPLPWMLAVA
jgi:hypothetical protein